MQLHTVSSLSQTETGNLQAKTAVTQGDDLKMLTKMTVVSHPIPIHRSYTGTPRANHDLQYVAFPLLFTTAFFSMDFVAPKYPWAAFFGVLVLMSLLNYMIASPRSSQRRWNECKAWISAFLGNWTYNRI